MRPESGCARTLFRLVRNQAVPVRVPLCGLVENAKKECEPAVEANLILAGSGFPCVLNEQEPKSLCFFVDMRYVTHYSS
jgi:hypothetical protein